MATGLATIAVIRYSSAQTAALILAVIASGALVVTIPWWATVLSVIALYPLAAVYSDFFPTSQLSSLKDYVLIGAVAVSLIRVIMVTRDRSVGVVGVTAIVWTGVVAAMSAFAQSPLVAALGFRTLGLYGLLSVSLIALLQNGSRVLWLRRIVIIDALVLAPYLILKFLRPTVVPVNPFMNPGDVAVDLSNRLHWDETIFLESTAALLLVTGQWPRRLYGRLGLAALPLLCVVLSQNKTAMLGILAGLLAVAGLRSTHFVRSLMVVGSLGLIAALVAPLSAPLQVLFNPESLSYSGRLAELPSYLPLILGRPYGYGTGSVSGALYASRYANVGETFTALIPILHNSMYAVVLEVGIQGLAAFIAVVVSVVRTATALRAVEGPQLGAARGAMAVVVATVAEMCVSPVVLSATVMLNFWIAVGIAGALSAMKLRSTRRESDRAGAVA